MSEWVSDVYSLIDDMSTLWLMICLYSLNHDKCILNNDMSSLIDDMSILWLMIYAYMKMDYWSMDLMIDWWMGLSIYSWIYSLPWSLSTNDDIPSSYILLTNKQTTFLTLYIRKFVADVMGDDLLQQEGGNALMKSVTYALQPGLIRITGFTLAVASIALAKIVLSPY